MVDASVGNMFGGGGVVDDLFGAAEGFIQASGYKKAAAAYKQGATYAHQNAQIAGETEQLQEIQAQRQIEQAIGTEQAQTGAAGLAGGGSAQYLLKQSVNQGALTKQLVSLQGAINVNAYNEEATAMEGQAASASAAATAATVGGIGSIVKGVASFFLSDLRAKTALHLEGRRPDGIGIYSFEYKGDAEHARYIGVVAQEVMKVHPEAVIADEDGFLRVDYGAIDATFGRIGHA